MHMLGTLPHFTGVADGDMKTRILPVPQQRQVNSFRGDYAMENRGVARANAAYWPKHPGQHPESIKAGASDLPQGHFE